MNTKCYFCKEKEGSTFAYSGTNCVLVCEDCAEKIRKASKERKEKENVTANLFNKRHARRISCSDSRNKR